ncbi:ATP synthase F1 subunit gamma [Spiroplasma diminutum]|uniref:ATP synthase gamma chain n=1 Tax=Spiroplasma diminutum CUAS-1 TaxID=1276221 RepID=S5LVD8_9MOLU|nr:ATP synthase F1 subunit gamma [Spiroplasma diminutum]AGR41759.1 F0F1 ATP synthase subunit gamma [Spiroplasma diminutum CUAS-1]
MPNLSELKSEINNINDIGKITGAMELVATAKLKKISKRMGSIQTYLNEVYDIFNYIISHSEDSIYLKKPNQVSNKTLWIVIGSNLGLCGGYNSNIFKTLKPLINKQTDNVIAIGSKVVSFCKANNIEIKEQYTDIDVDFSNEQSRKMSVNLLNYFVQKEFDEIKIVYTKFINNVTFEPKVLDMFPIEKKEEDNEIHQDVILEPDPETVLTTSVSMYLNTILFGTIIESQVSEQANRRMAMEAANKNGKEISENLSVLFNRKRQENITQEISEIIGGANAQSEG